MISIKGHEIPNRADEFTVEQFDYLNKITRNNLLDNIEKWMNKFIYLGVPEEVFDDMKFEEFQEYIFLYNNSEMQLDKITSVEIDGYTYEAPERIGVKDLGLIEKAWKVNADNFSVETLAILFKRTDLTKKEHYTPAHLKQKQKLFKSQKANLAVPYVFEILKELNNTAEKLNKDVAEELETNKG